MNGGCELRLVMPRSMREKLAEILLHVSSGVPPSNLDLVVSHSLDLRPAPCCLLFLGP